VRVRRYALLVSVLLVSLLLLTVQTRGGSARWATDLVAVVTAPVQSALAKMHRVWLSVWTEYVGWKTVRLTNAALRADNERLRLESLRVRETEDENRRLRQLLDLKERLPLSVLAGEVIGREGAGWVRALTVNRGRTDGIAVQTPVIVPEGLVGRVVRAQPGASIVQLLNDPASTVGALVQRTRTPGLIEGEPGGTLRFKFMARDGAGVAAGDLVVTSAGGGVFPRGLPVGRIAAIEDRGSALFHYALVVPAVDFARVEEVLLLTGQTTQDLAGVFTSGG
jgi:rod shape-determining protein MreC